LNPAASTSQLRPEALTPQQFGLLAALRSSAILKGEWPVIRKSVFVGFIGRQRTNPVAGRIWRALNAAMVILHVVEFVPTEPMGEDTDAGDSN